VAQAEAELSDDVRRRLRAAVRAPVGWVPSAPDSALESAGLEPISLEPVFPEPSSLDLTSREYTAIDAAGCGDQAAWDATGREENGTEENGTEENGEVDRDTQRPVLASTGAGLRASLAARLPLGLRGAQVVPSRAAVAGLAGLLAASLALVLLLTWWQRPHESPVPSVRRSVPASAVATLSPTPTPSPHVVVQVTGAVRRPGLVRLPAGSRVDDAVSAVGGATGKADLASVNLARLLVDGEQIVVLRKGQAIGPVIAPGPPAQGSASPGQPVDLNTATLEQLDGLPGVGPVLAQRILDWRTHHGRFSSVDELTEVSGIGERTLADIKPLVRV
jgi:competence protein ComEA